MKKLTDKQKQIIVTLRKYPNDLIMMLDSGCWLTGGHGVHFDKRTLNSLRDKGLIDYKKLTELGKTINLM